MAQSFNKSAKTGKKISKSLTKYHLSSGRGFVPLKLSKLKKSISK